MLPVATHYFDGTQVRAISDADKTYLQMLDDQWAGQAMRNLCYAYKDLAVFSGQETMQEIESGLTIVGLVSMIDPPRETVAAAIEACHLAHIKVVIITGDYALTAGAI
ncbi:MAG: cation-transporting P-type ATPase [Candidatus Peribacteria bacterium]|nr:MAG: cation-transporting P-type ATPase [Candidatus Peribacteria bacterium]